MRILYTVTKSEMGGAQVHVRSLMEEFKKRGHDVALMSFPGGWLHDEARKLGIPFFPNRSFRNSYNVVNLFRALRDVRRSVARFRPDIISCHSSGAGFLTRLAVRGKIPTVFTAHGWAFVDGAPFVRRWVAILAERIAARYARAIICVSEFDKRLALRYGVGRRESLTVIRNGIPSYPAREARDESPLRVITVGRLAAPKNFPLLIEAFAQIVSNVLVPVKLVIVGDGPNRRRIEKKIKRLHLENSVTLVGAKTNEETVNLMRSSDIFVLASRREGFPMTVLEAMAVGLPIIASEVGGIPEALRPDAGVLVENTARSFARALGRLIREKEERSRLGNAARTRAQTLFSLDRFVDETEKVFIGERKP